MHETATDGELLARYCRHGDARAFDVLYERHRLPLFNFLFAHSGRRRQDVEEVFQETWLKVIRNAAQFDTTQAFAPWLYRIARNCLVDRWRHLGVVASLHVADDVSLSGASSNGLHQPERLLGSREIGDRWRHALSALPSLQRETLLLKLENDFSLEEIAAITGTERETVKSRLRYATAKMREMLAEVVDERA